jgi:hypothetical protein
LQLLPNRWAERRQRRWPSGDVVKIDWPRAVD